jgi:phosphatidylinositol alpha-1,6-mannosyltransferase
MKVFALLTDGPGARGGIARYNQDLLQALAESDLVREIRILPRNGGEDPATLPGKTINLSPAGKRWNFTARAILEARHFGSSDWIFCGHLFMLPLAVLLSRVTGAKVWLQLHGIEAWQAHGRLTGHALSRVAFVTVVSRYTRQRFIAWSGVAPERVRVLPNTVSEVFHPGPGRQTTGHDGVTLLSVSRLTSAERYKGQDRVLAALARLQGQTGKTEYLIAGEGDDIPRLQALAGQYGLQDVVRFVGYIADEQLPQLYRDADIFAMPSTGEGFGIVFLQALASGCTVIAGNSDGSRDPLLDGRAGILVAPDNTEELTEAIRQAMVQPRDGTFAATVFSRENFRAHVHALMSGLPALSRPGVGG